MSGRAKSRPAFVDFSTSLEVTVFTGTSRASVPDEFDSVSNCFKYHNGLLAPLQKALLFFGIIPFSIYHLAVYNTASSTNANLLVLFGYYPIIIMLRDLKSDMTPAEIDPYLKKTALRTLLLILLFGISEIIQ